MAARSSKLSAFYRWAMPTAECPRWVISRRHVAKRAFPLYLSKQTSASGLGTSASARNDGPHSDKLVDENPAEADHFACSIRIIP
jgi:hypothetical protein